MLDLPMSHKRTNVAVKESGAWSDLHEDILALIKGKLYLIEQLRFRAVCRSWYSVPSVKSADKLPWILALRKAIGCKYLAYYLYDPSNRIEYVLGHQLSRFLELEVYASKHGWLFLGDSDSKLFLYHPFTKKTIHLPNRAAPSLCDTLGTFSGVPNCSDCVFYVLHTHMWMTETIVLYIYRNGDVTWSKFELASLSPPQHIVCSKGGGLLYCFLNNGLLCAFDVAYRQWWQIPIDASQIEFQARLEGYLFKAIESDGELLLVYYNLHSKPWYVFKLDWSLMAWVKQVNLGDQALFIGEASFSVPTDGKIKSLAGNIYFHGVSSPFFYRFNSSSRSKGSEFRPLRCNYYSLLTRLPRQFEWVWVEPRS